MSELLQEGQTSHSDASPAAKRTNSHHNHTIE